VAAAPIRPIRRISALNSRTEQTVPGNDNDRVRGVPPVRRISSWTNHTTIPTALPEEEQDEETMNANFEQQQQQQEEEEDDNKDRFDGWNGLSGSTEINFRPLRRISNLSNPGDDEDEDENENDTYDDDADAGNDEDTTTSHSLSETTPARRSSYAGPPSRRSSSLRQSMKSIPEDALSSTTLSPGSDQDGSLVPSLQQHLDSFRLAAARLNPTMPLESSHLPLPYRFQEGEDYKDDDENEHTEDDNHEQFIPKGSNSS
jgi:hypothetical protein